MKNKRMLLFIILFLTPLLGGCWNQRELTDLAFVMAMGIDPRENGKQGYTITYEIVNPSNVTTGQMGGGGGLPIGVYKSSGINLTDAFRAVSKRLSRQLYYAHTSVIVVNEKLARKEGVLNLLDRIDRDAVLRPTTQLIIAKDSSAERIVGTLTILDKLPVNKISKTLKSTERMLGENIKVNIDDFISGLVSSGKEPISNGFALVGKKNQGMESSNIESTEPKVILKADGLAVFKKGKLVGWLKDKKARGVIWILNKIVETDLNLDWNGKKRVIGIITIRTKTKLSPSIQNNKPVMDIDIQEEGNLIEADTAIDLTDPAVIKQIEEKTEKEIQTEVLKTVSTVQKKYKSDIFGFGEEFHRKEPAFWKKNQNNWDEYFADLKVNVHVKSYIRRIGIRTKPFWSDLKK